MAKYVRVYVRLKMDEEKEREGERGKIAHQIIRMNIVSSERCHSET